MSPRERKPLPIKMQIIAYCLEHKDTPISLDGLTRAIFNTVTPRTKFIVKNNMAHARKMLEEQHHVLMLTLTREGKTKEWKFATPVDEKETLTECLHRKSRMEGHVNAVERALFAIQSGQLLSPETVQSIIGPMPWQKSIELKRDHDAP